MRDFIPIEPGGILIKDNYKNNYKNSETEPKK